MALLDDGAMISLLRIRNYSYRTLYINLLKMIKDSMKLVASPERVKFTFLELLKLPYKHKEINRWSK